MNGHIRIEALHMYCKTLIYTDKLGEVRGTVEDTPDGSLLLWEGEFDCSADRKAVLLEAVKQRMFALGRKCHIILGARR